MIPKKMNSWLVTPAVSPEIVTARTAAATASKAASGGSGKASSGGSGRTFEEVYAAIAPYFEPETVEYHPVDADTLQRLLEASIRPAYDRAIERRRENTAAYNADLDADAWSRGIGQSSYVTDVKQRNQRDESRDVGTLEASYGAVLAQRLMDALSEQEERVLETAKFNAEQRNNAQNRAYQAAVTMYRSGASGSGSGSAQKEQSSTPALSIYRQLMLGLDDGVKTFDVPAAPKEEAELYLERLTPVERGALYRGTDAQSGKILRSIEKTYGAWGLKELQKKYPSA